MEELIKIVTIHQPEVDTAAVIAYVVDRPDLPQIVWMTSLSKMEKSVNRYKYYRNYQRNMQGFYRKNDKAIQQLFHNVYYMEVNQALAKIEDFICEVVTRPYINRENATKQRKIQRDESKWSEDFKSSVLYQKHGIK